MIEKKYNENPVNETKEWMETNVTLGKIYLLFINLLHLYPFDLLKLVEALFIYLKREAHLTPESR